MKYVGRLTRSIGVPLLMVAFLAMAGCGRGTSDDQSAQLDDLKNELASLEKQVSQKEQELSSMQRQVDAREKELDECKKDQEAAKNRLEGMQ